MKRMFYLLTALFALLFVSSSSAYPTRRTDRAIKQVLQEFQAVGTSAAVVKDGKIVYSHTGYTAGSEQELIDKIKSLK